MGKIRLVHQYGDDFWLPSKLLQMRNIFGTAAFKMILEIQFVLFRVMR